jgi:hypothetical protein
VGDSPLVLNQQLMFVDHTEVKPITPLAQEVLVGRYFYFILFYFILFYFILFYFILFYFILFYFILFFACLPNTQQKETKFV